jgi:hypothetical protein
MFRPRMIILTLIIIYKKFVSFLQTYKHAYLLTYLLTYFFLPSFLTYLLTFSFHPSLLTYLLFPSILPSLLTSSFHPSFLTYLLLPSILPSLLTYLLYGAVFYLRNSAHLVNKFPAFYGTRRFITALTNAHHLSLSWARSIQSIPLHPTSWRSVLIPSYHLRLDLPSGVFPLSFPNKTLYAPLLFPIRATFPAHLILPQLITRTILHINLMWFWPCIVVNMWT